MNKFNSIEAALYDLRAGRMVILTDDDQREGEGDLVIAAEKITPEAINFMSKHARGLICLTLTKQKLEQLQIPLMPTRNKLPNQAAFTVSIEAAKGVSTGISAQDRAHTIKVACSKESMPNDISMPGHVFPLQAKEGGVLVRPGHTEGSIDLVKLAGLEHAAVICEVIKDDGSMARLPDLMEFANQHQISIVSIHDLIAYRLAHENVVEEIASADLPLEHNKDFTVKIFRNSMDGKEHVALIHKNRDPNKPCLVRIHSECLTGDVFGSSLCDCGEQLKSSIRQLSAEPGILLYMRQEGRGIGLGNKIKAYDLQRNQGLDTVEANHKLGFKGDIRCYSLSAQILKNLSVTEIRLLTNNPNKVEALMNYGINVVERVALETQPTTDNIQYLTTKRDKLGHLLNL